ncbi:MAG: Stf0 family sulfotransferase [Planctomycetota bacterium]
MTPHRFDRQPNVPRVAAFHGWRFPVAEDADSYPEVERLVASVGGDLRFFHAGIPDPSGMGPELKARAGRAGFFVPFLDQIHQNDFHHFRRTRPDQVSSLLVGIGRIAQESEEAVWNRPVVRASFSLARWAQGWGADLVIARGQYEPAVHALITASLLGVPMALCLPWISEDSSFAALLPAQVEVATVVWTGNQGVADVLLERFGDVIRPKLVGPGGGEEVLLARMRDALSRSDAPSRLAHGPAAAFRPTGTPVGKPLDAAPNLVPRARPFVILGSERTGSNLLVGLLDQQSGFACAGELFNPRDIDERTIAWLENREFDKSELLHLRSISPDALCDRLLRDGAAGGADWVGFKLLYYHGLIDDRVIHFLVDHPDLYLVHLRRRDRLARWLSHRRAEVKDEWFKGQRERVDASKQPSIELDPSETVSDFEWQQLLEERYAAIFAGRRVLEIDYEDFAADLAGTRARLADFFGREFGEMVPLSRKTGEKSARDGIANYESLLQAVRGTVWESLVKDLEKVDEAKPDTE